MPVLRQGRHPESLSKSARSPTTCELSDGLEPEQGVDVAAGKKIFADNCAACHGEDGKGNLEMGAPNLTTKVWQYGSDINDLDLYDHLRPQQRDARVGQASRPGDDQVAGGVRSQPGRRSRENRVR